MVCNGIRIIMPTAYEYLEHFLFAGLLDGLIDGCLQFTITLERANNANFTFPYSDPGKRGIYVKTGNPYGVDPNGGNFLMGTSYLYWIRCTTTK